MLQDLHSGVVKLHLVVDQHCPHDVLLLLAFRTAF